MQRQKFTKASLYTDSNIYIFTTVNLIIYVMIQKTFSKARTYTILDYEIEHQASEMQRNR